MIRTALKCFIACIFVLVSASSLAGFYIENGKLFDNSGSPFVMRGINHAHAWYTDRTGAYRDIAATGANTVRVVLSSGRRWKRNAGNDVAHVIKLCKENKLIIVLEVHDATGWSEDEEAAHISTAVDYWLSDDIYPVIQGEEDYVIINIANEAFGNNIEPDVYVRDTIAAIRALRQGGLKHTIMVDAANWGQDWQHVMRDYAGEIADADPDGNILFSVHMYEVYGQANIVKDYMQHFDDAKLPLVVGEFGADHRGQDVDEDTILSLADEYGMGYLGWSWSGNGDCCTSLDIVIDFDPDNYSAWGDRLINGENGIKQTSKIAGVYRVSWWRSLMERLQKTFYTE